MKPIFRKNPVAATRKFGRVIPLAYTTDEHATVADAVHPAETEDFTEAHEDPEQSAELERQQDA